LAHILHYKKKTKDMGKVIAFCIIAVFAAVCVSSAGLDK